MKNTVSCRQCLQAVVDRYDTVEVEGLTPDGQPLQFKVGTATQGEDTRADSLEL